MELLSDRVRRNNDLVYALVAVQRYVFGSVVQRWLISEHGRGRVEDWQKIAEAYRVSKHPPEGSFSDFCVFFLNSCRAYQHLIEAAKETFTNDVRIALEVGNATCGYEPVRIPWISRGWPSECEDKARQLNQPCEPVYSTWTEAAIDAIRGSDGARLLSAILVALENIPATEESLTNVIDASIPVLYSYPDIDDGFVCLRLRLEAAKAYSQIGLPSQELPPELTSDWLTVTQAARRYIEHLKPMKITLGYAKGLMTKLCDKGTLRSTGKGRSRRVAPDSVDAQALAAIKADIEKEDAID